jgi:hypothetical protein
MDHAQGEILPTMLASSDIARRIKRNPKTVSSFLTRYAAKHGDCRIENSSKRKNDSVYFYRTDEVWPAIQEWLSDNPND